MPFEGTKVQRAAKVDGSLNGTEASMGRKSKEKAARREPMVRSGASSSPLLDTGVSGGRGRRGEGGKQLGHEYRRQTRRMSKRASSDLRQSAVRYRRSLDCEMYRQQTRGVPTANYEKQAYICFFHPPLVPPR